VAWLKNARAQDRDVELLFGGELLRVDLRFGRRRFLVTTTFLVASAKADAQNVRAINARPLRRIQPETADSPNDVLTTKYAPI
jgi:hypothetical protein